MKQHNFKCASKSVRSFARSLLQNYITVLTCKTLEEKHISFSLFFSFSILCCRSPLRWTSWPFREKAKHLNVDFHMKPEYNTTLDSIQTVVFNSFEGQCCTKPICIKYYLKWNFCFVLFGDTYGVNAGVFL